MFATRSSDWMLSLKKLVTGSGCSVAIVPLSYYLSLNGKHAEAWNFLLPTIIFSLIPLVDALLGRDPANPEERLQVPAMENALYYRILTLVCVPVLLSLLGWGGWVLARNTMWSWLDQLGWTLSIGEVMGAIGITVAHELVHKDPAIEQNAGGLLLAAVCYAGFKVEHVRGHHVHV
jgi:alkane 1-monooxygenase